MASTRGPIVYIAEDNEILLEGLERALSANGYAVRTARDGARMIDLLSRGGGSPALLLLDVMMPAVSGVEVLAWLRADPRWARLPVILLTAATDESVMAAVAGDDLVELLIKPFRLPELLARVAHHVAEDPQIPSVS